MRRLWGKQKRRNGIGELGPAWIGAIAALITALTAAGFFAGRITATSPGVLDSAPSGSQTVVSAKLGGVDVEKYCKDNFGRHAVIREENVYGWRCNTDQKSTNGVKSDDISVNMTDSCRQQYNRVDAFDRHGSFADPTSWACYD